MLIEKKEYACWDIGGKLIYGGEQETEYFGSGSQFGIEMFVKNIPVTGVIWVVNINQDIQHLMTSKMVLHEIVEGYHQLQDIQLLMVYNKKPDIIRKENTNADEGLVAREIFVYDEIKQINNAWQECPFNLEQLDKFFEIEKLKHKTKPKSYLIDVNEKQNGAEVFKYIGD